MIEITDAMLEAALDAMGERVEPFTAPRESGVALECDTSAEDAAEINAEIKKGYRTIFEAMMSAAPQEVEWQPIETAPKDSKDLLLCVAGFSPLTGHWNDARRCWVSHPDHTHYEPTHWMHIQSPPAASNYIQHEGE